MPPELSSTARLDLSRPQPQLPPTPADSTAASTRSPSPSLNAHASSSSSDAAAAAAAAASDDSAPPVRQSSPQSRKKSHPSSALGNQKALIAPANFHLPFAAYPSLTSPSVDPSNKATFHTTTDASSQNPTAALLEATQLDSSLFRPVASLPIETRPRSISHGGDHAGTSPSSRMAASQASTIFYSVHSMAPNAAVATFTSSAVGTASGLVSKVLASSLLTQSLSSSTRTVTRDHPWIQGATHVEEISSEMETSTNTVVGPDSVHAGKRQDNAAYLEFDRNAAVTVKSSANKAGYLPPSFRQYKPSDFRMNVQSNQSRSTGVPEKYVGSCSGSPFHSPE